MHSPWSLILCLAFIYLLIVVYALGDRFRFLRKLHGRNTGILVLTGMLVLLLADGFFPFRVNRNPVFVCMLLAFAAVLILQTLDDLGHLRQRNPGRTLSHTALSLLLLAGIFGSGDTQKVQVMLIEGLPKAAGTDAEGFRVELPFTLTLENFSAESPVPDRQRFLSRIRIERPDGRTATHAVAVNHPAKAGPWRIYQQGYDAERGAESTVSILECVKDPWYPAVQAGLWLMLAAAVMTACTPGVKKREAR